MHEKQIQREMFEARQNLEENLGKLVHKARETVSIRARIEHAIAERPALIGIAAAAGAGFALLLHRR